MVPRLPVRRVAGAGLSALGTSEAFSLLVVSEPGCSFFLAGCDAGLLRLGGTRPLDRLGAGAGAGASVVTVGSGVAVGTAKSSGVGCGVGAAATSSLTTGGSAMRAPTEETRLEPLPREATLGADSDVGLRASTRGASPAIGSKDPPNLMW